MKIIIDLPEYPPAIYSPSWDALNNMIRSCYELERQVTITGIGRLDGGVNYRKPGEYWVTLDHEHTATLTVEL